MPRPEGGTFHNMKENASADRLPRGLEREPRSAGRAPTTAVTGAQSIQRAFSILRLLANSGSGGMRLTEIAQDLELSTPTTYRILKVLSEEGVVERLGGGRRYVVGAEVALLGLSTRARVKLQEIADPVLAALSQEVGDALFLTVRSGFDSVCAQRKIGTYPVQVLSIGVGSRRPLGVSVGGMAILSGLPLDEATLILEANAPRFASYRVTQEALTARLHTARAQGYVYADPAIVRSTRAIAVPIFDQAGQPAAAISTITIRPRLPAGRVDHLVMLLRRAAGELSEGIRESAKSRRR